MLNQILRVADQELIRSERRLLNDLRAALIRFGASEDTRATLDRSIEQLDELFLLVVVGEFNAGKSAFINALVGGPVLPEGVTPTTAQVTLLKHGESVPVGTRGEVTRDNVVVVTASADILRDIHIVDTPGTNAVMREHERLTSEFVPRSDLVLFVTSADRPFTETERAFLEYIREWGKKIVIVINKIDIFHDEGELEEVRRFVEANAQLLLGTVPEIFPVSARLAIRAKRGDPSHWQASRFEPLERYIRDTLDQASRLKLKLLNPLGIGVSLTNRYLGLTRERLTLLADDFAALEDVEAQLGLYEQDMLREFEGRMAEVENVLLQMERRGHDFFDDTLRIGRVMDLLNRARVQQGFEQQVVADAPQQIERKVHELVDWLVDNDYRQWQRVSSHLAERRREYRERILGERGDPETRAFHHDRTRLVEAVGRETQRAVDTFDRRREASELADGARNAVAAAAAAGAGALGLGTLVTVAASTAVADVTGLIMASVLAALGFFIIPARRQKAKDEMRRKITDVRERLSLALRTQFEREIRASTARIREGIAPYSRFVRAEGDKLRATEQQLLALTCDLEVLRSRVDELAAFSRGRPDAGLNPEPEH
ncbi:MAG TPA: dynamin family protein [Vicinamibacterales bacterium]|nr:dynamin family protein [Vicinamibacterales bacterium]